MQNVIEERRSSNKTCSKSAPCVTWVPLLLPVTHVGGGRCLSATQRIIPGHLFEFGVCRHKTPPPPTRAGAVRRSCRHRALGLLVV